MPGTEDFSGIDSPKVEEPKSIAVLHHGPACQDGFAAAWAAWKALKESADYIPVNYGDPVPDIRLYETVYIVDFSFQRDILHKMAQTAHVIVIDHHKTAKDELSDLKLPNGGSVIFDLEHSGAVLTWKYFHPDKPVPPLLEYVEDRDLWKWQLPDSRAVSAALSITDRKFDAWSIFNSWLKLDDWELIARGEAVLAYQKQTVDRACKHAEPRQLLGYNVPCMNCTGLVSEVGEELNRLYPESPFSATYFIQGDSQKWSLRSRPGGIDVGAIAKGVGGGGHPAAAGFELRGIENFLL